MCVREGHFCRRRTFQRFISLIMVLTDCNATFTSKTPWAGRAWTEWRVRGASACGGVFEALAAGGGPS